MEIKLKFECPPEERPSSADPARQAIAARVQRLKEKSEARKQRARDAK